MNYIKTIGLMMKVMLFYRKGSFNKGFLTAIRLIEEELNKS